LLYKEGWIQHRQDSTRRLNKDIRVTESGKEMLLLAYSKMRGEARLF